MTEYSQDFKLLGKFKGGELEFMKFDVALHQLLDKYDIVWKEIQYVGEEFTEEELKR